MDNGLKMYSTLFLQMQQSSAFNSHLIPTTSVPTRERRHSTPFLPRSVRRTARWRRGI